MRKGSVRSRHGVTGTARWIGRIAVLTGLGCMLLGLVAPPAGANYGRIAAEARCDRTVSWTASASAEGTADERTNEKVLVEYRPAGSGSTWTMTGPSGRFDAENGFTFSGSFPLPEAEDSVEVRVTPQVRWGAGRDGAEPGASRYATATLPEGCSEHPLVVTIAGNCDAGGATVTIENIGAGTSAASLSVDRIVVREVELDPGKLSTLTVPILEGTSAAIRVEAGDFVVSRQEVRADCSLPGPAATITERCDARQAVVLATSDATTAQPVEIRAADAIVHRADLVPGEVMRRTLELPPTGSIPVEVEVGGTVIATAAIGGCSGPVTGAVTCGTPGRSSCAVSAAPTTTVPAPPPPPPPLTIELDEHTLATTGPWQRAVVLLLGGALLAGGGAALVLEQRRRPRPSLLAAVVAPYRQRWWDEV